MMQLQRSEQAALRTRYPLLLVTEGVSDIEFLKAISGVLHADDLTVVDLSTLELQGELVFIPSGGGEIATWHGRLQRLPNPRFQLHDRETGPESLRRLAAAASISGPGCRVELTSKRALENYLHRAAIVAAGGPPVEVTDYVNVPAAVAESQFTAEAPQGSWQLLTPRARKRLICRAKRWLNTRAAGQMTPQLLDQRDPRGEVRWWLASIAALLPSDR